MDRINQHRDNPHMYGSMAWKRFEAEKEKERIKCAQVRARKQEINNNNKLVAVYGRQDVFYGN